MEENNIEELKRLLYRNELSQYGKRKLIDYYEQQEKDYKKSIKMNYETEQRLQKGINRLKEKNKNLENEAVNAKIDKIKKNYISKQKITDKIEYLDNQRKQWLEDRELKVSDTEIKFVIDVLQELLGSEE